MVSSLGFGSTPGYSHALFGLAFATAPPGYWLNLAAEGNSPAHSTKGTPSPRYDMTAAHRAPTVCKRRVSGLFHPPCGALFTFPSRYSCTIGHREYLAFDGGPPSFPPNSTC